MNKSLYSRLALTNIRKNGRLYIPYFITGMITVAMFYIMCALTGNKGLDQMHGSAEVKMILTLGSIVIAIFSVIFLFYTNSFIMKRRKKELGIYNILGMEKKHLAKVLFLETLYTLIVSVGGGLLIGILFNKLMCMLLFRLMGFDAGVDFYVSGSCCLLVVVLFCGIYVLTLIFNLLQLKLANPIQLLHGGNVGEREPKTKMIMTLLGFACLGAGYYIAITTKSPLSALMLFFVAVVLVIIGTYFLFIAGSVAMLKLLRRNKKYYYKTSHFTAVSGMLYRMKQNAVGLANICILSTMVLVMVSTTVSLYLGVEDELDSRFTSDIAVQARYDSFPQTDMLTTLVDQSVGGSHLEMKNIEKSVSVSITCFQDGSVFKLDPKAQTGGYEDITFLAVMTKADYEQLFDKQLGTLEDGEVILSGIGKQQGKMDTIQIADQTYKVAGWEKDISKEDAYAANMIKSMYYVVVPGEEQMQKIYEKQKEIYGNLAGMYTCDYAFDLSGSRQEKIDCYNNLVSELMQTTQEDNTRNWDHAYVEGKDGMADEFHQLYGGFFFLGAFLGTMFLMITVLIIFYKQISEGYDDKERFAIMEKVGMSNREVRQTIRSQVRTVFLLPILTAAVHVAAAFPMIRRLLFVMNLTNTKLFAGCLAGTLVVFIVIYLIVFLVTSRTYYRIVGEQV